jgi:hypothetical protein
MVHNLFSYAYFRKKMNFTTDLPKKNPIVSYIVASAVKCEKFFPGCSKEGPVYRMHAVILKNAPGGSSSTATGPSDPGLTGDLRKGSSISSCTSTNDSNLGVSG